MAPWAYHLKSPAPACNNSHKYLLGNLQARQSNWNGLKLWSYLFSEIYGPAVGPYEKLYKTNSTVQFWFRSDSVFYLVKAFKSTYEQRFIQEKIN